VVTATAFDIPAGTYFQPTSPPAVEAAGSADLNLTAFAAGGQVGYNRSSGRFVFGGEADVSAMQLSGSATTTAAYPCCPTNNFTIKQSVDTDWLFSARLHFGYVFGEWLLSGTGGLAMTKLAYRANFSDTFTASESAASDDIQVGWTAGGSVEHRMNTHWSLKATYLYAAFGETTVTSTNLKQSNGATFPNTPFNHAVDLKVKNRKDLVVHVRKGYYAPLEGKAPPKKPSGVDPVIQEALDSPYEMPDIPLRIKMGLHPRQGCRAHSPAQVRVFNQVIQILTEARARFFGGQKKARLAVGDNLRDAAGAGGDNRSPARHRVEQRGAEPFGHRAHHEQIEALDAPEHVGPEARQQDVLLEVMFAHLLLEVLAQLTLAEDHEARVGNLLHHEVRGVDQVPLSFVRHQRGDVAHHR
jgi:outer membrane immunogenic protein